MVRMALAGLLLVAQSAAGGEIVESSVVKDNGTFLIDVLARIDASLDEVHFVITDYANLTQINSSIVESYIIDSPTPGNFRVFTRLEFCVMLFCKKFRQVQDIVEEGKTALEAHSLPELSDIKSGVARWNLVVADDGTYMEFTAKIVPGFWVPPFIDSWLFNREISKQVLETVHYIEAQGAD